MTKERCFSLSMWALIKESNEAKVLTILEALHSYALWFYWRLIVESNSFNAISWMNTPANRPWKFFNYFQEIKLLSSSIQISFQHMSRSANGMADCFAKQEVDMSVPLSSFI